MKKQYGGLYVVVVKTQEDIVTTSGVFDVKTGDTMYDYKNIF